MHESELIATLGFAAAVLMVRFGSMKKMIELRRSPAICSACGRSYAGRFCPVCGRR